MSTDRIKLLMENAISLMEDSVVTDSPEEQCQFYQEMSCFRRCLGDTESPKFLGALHALRTQKQTILGCKDEK